RKHDPDQRCRDQECRDNRAHAHVVYCRGVRAPAPGSNDHSENGQAFFLTSFGGFSTPLAKASSRYFSASSALTRSAGAISLMRLILARSYIVRSAADSEASRLRAARFRTTSATWYTSPLFNFSWWFLNRRLQLEGTRGSGFDSTETRSSNSSAFTGGRTPTSSVFNVGTDRVISLMTVRRIRYSCVEPKASIFLVPCTMHAPCWG